MISYSQPGSKQDLWVLKTLNNQKNGIFIDIGCATPFYLSNTASLEKYYNWTGLAFDINFSNSDYVNSDLNEYRGTEYNDWNLSRTNTKTYEGDALTFDYLKIFKENNIPPIIDYLSIDLEPPEVTLEAFKKLPHDQYKFKTITFEHDSYRRSNDWLTQTRNIITSYGYVLVETKEQDDFYILSA